MSPAAHADELGSPVGPVILSISGAIGITNVDKEARFDRSLFEGLGLVELRTTTPWTEGLQLFEGVSVERVLSAVEAEGTTLRAKALNDYVVDIDMDFARESRALIAVKMNGAYMRVRDKGPLWIVFPWGEQPDLDEEFMKTLSVWQLSSLEVR